jgi:biopolymer transport protein ExbB/TolQ
MPSFQELFADADAVVKAVMAILMVLSLASWVVILEKTTLLARSGRVFRAFAKKAKALPAANEIRAEDFPGCASGVVGAGLAESLDFSQRESRAEYGARLERAMRRPLAEWTARMESRVPALATVGSTSPFIGLFGTVWGIMNSFVGIARSGETTLAVVAPGIAEALSATALGLVAAIPAVVAFNKIKSSTRRLVHEATTAIALVADTLARSRYSDV